MSWDGYITNLKAPDTNGCVTIEEAAIWGQNPLSAWASSNGFINITAAELKGLNGDRTCLQQGMMIAGKKCMLVKDQLDTEGEHMLYLKTKKEGEEGVSCCVIIGKTKTAYVITKGCATAQGGEVSTKTYGIVKYLHDANM